MKRIFISLLLTTFTALPAMAHIEPGLWYGKTDEGKTCFMEVGPQYFVDDIHHPLNERIDLRVLADKFTVGHPPVVDPSQKITSFNHDLFQGVIATPKGGRSIQIEMVHEPKNEGPVSFTVIDHQWKSDVRTMIKCSNIKHK